MADDKFEDSVKRFRETMEGIRSAQRVTCRLPDEFLEVPTRGGKRMRVVSRNDVEEQSKGHSQNTKVLSNAAKQEIASGSRNAALIKYPPGGRGIELSTHSWLSLEPQTYLDDNVINIMLMWARDHFITNLGNVIEVCDSFMYAQMIRGVNPRETSTMTKDLEENFKRIQRYKSIRKPGDVSMTLIPVCEENHWYLLVLILHKETARNIAVILIADSLPVSSREHAANIVKLFVGYNCTGETETTVHSLPVIQQQNLYDCGLHTIHNAMKMIKMAETNDCVDIPQITEVMIETPCPISREQIRAVIQCLIRGENATNVCDDIMKTNHSGNDTSSSSRNNHSDTHDISEHTNAGEIQNVGKGALEIPYGHTVVLDAHTQVENGRQELWGLTPSDIAIITDIIRVARKGMETSGAKRIKFLKGVSGQQLSFRLWARHNVTRVVRI